MNLKKLNFVNLSGDRLDSKVQQYIITNNLYELSVKNLHVVLVEGNNSNDSDFYSKNYNTVLNSDKKYIVDYVNNNIEIYVKQILLNEQITCDNEPIELILTLLENEGVNLDSKKELIKKVNVKFSDISVFVPELYQVLFDCDRVEPNWKNIQFAFEKTGFETVSGFIKHTPIINGDFVSLDGINTATPVNLINAILLNLSKEEILIVAKTMPVITLLSAINMMDIGDEKLAGFIKENGIQFANTDLPLLIDYPHSLNQYINVYKNQVIKDFDAFFAEAFPIIKKQNQQVYENGYYRTKIFTEYREKPNSQKVIATVLSCKDADKKIKTLLVEKCVEIINISGYVNIYADYIINERQSVPARVLWQFSQTQLSFLEKIEILEICQYGGDSPDPKEIKKFLMSLSDVFIQLYSGKTKVKIEKSNAIHKMLVALLDRGLINDYGKVRNREEYWIS